MRKTLKETILETMTSSKKKSFSVEQLAEMLDLQKSNDFKELVQAIAQMEREQLVTFNQKGKIKLVTKDTVLEGVFRSNERGFGFVTVEGEESDVFVSRDDTFYALEGDKVEIEILKPGNPLEDQAPEGKVVKIIERGMSQIVGIFTLFTESEQQETGLYGVVTPKDKKLSRYKVFIASEGLLPEDGSVVSVEVTHYPEVGYTNSFEGLVKQVIGHKNDPGMDILSIVLQLGIPTDFDEATLKQAEELPDEVLESELLHRVDLRKEVVVTIDGAEAKDLDDAVRVEKLDNGNYFLGVYIADVSHYVTENSPLDAEASDRATSVYLTDRVIPMLPRKLSNGICSLNPNVDRLAMACEMEINRDGDVVSHDIFETVIHSTARMTYDEVNDIIEGTNEVTSQKYETLVPMFHLMNDLHTILETKRANRGAISFEDREAYIVVDAEGHPVDIKLRTRKAAERLIESFMLAANETVAKTYTDKQLPFIYRIHEHPKEEKVQRFLEFMTNFGIMVKGKKDAVSPKELQRVLDQVNGRPEEPVVSMMLLRSMQQAKYSEDPVGHYGLAADDYTHFTSPIRRYPDLIVHRLIKSYEKEKVTDKIKQKWDELIPDIADHSSKMERRAVEAERETDKLKKTEFMQDKVDEEFDGIITSITKFGMFIELPNTIEGLVHVNQLKDDYYHFIETHMAFVGERTGKVYKIGQKVRVKLTKADVDTREIDFDLLSAEPLTEKIELPKKNKKSSSSSRRKDQKKSFGKSDDSKKGKKGKNGKKPFYKSVNKKPKKKKK
ncbi:ribonuclease R [Vagococcus bubulae]|uniref:Ribonuclease R n=1 Tax=Vagococcus bubulae TaxID=1977868 RepID=A0A429ZI88_9ENTE|nr:ribonuclease R [Vagococcus bubulae]RST93440.1 ribonuclease R [Vagococcus bubulae]